MNEAIRTLALAVQKLTEERMQVAGELIVLVAAVQSLVKTHPEPEQFAAAFRSTWIELGQRHSDGEGSPHALFGIDITLSTIEDACAVPLKVRPPRAG